MGNVKQALLTLLKALVRHTEAQFVYESHEREFLSEQCVVEKLVEFFFADAALFGGVAVAKGDGAVFFDGFEIDGNAPRSAGFVLTAIAFADGPGGIPEDIVAFRKLVEDGSGSFDQLRLVFQ